MAGKFYHTDDSIQDNAEVRIMLEKVATPPPSAIHKVMCPGVWYPEPPEPPARDLDLKDPPAPR